MECGPTSNGLSCLVELSVNQFHLRGNERNYFEKFRLSGVSYFCNQCFFNFQISYLEQQSGRYSVGKRKLFHKLESDPFLFAVVTSYSIVPVRTTMITMVLISVNVLLYLIKQSPVNNSVIRTAQRARIHGRGV